MESEDYHFYQGLVYLLENDVSTLGYDLTFSTEVCSSGEDGGHGPQMGSCASHGALGAKHNEVAPTCGPHLPMGAPGFGGPLCPTAVPFRPELCPPSLPPGRPPGAGVWGVRGAGPETQRSQCAGDRGEQEGVRAPRLPDAHDR